MEYQFTIDQVNYTVNIQPTSDGHYKADISDKAFELDLIPVSEDQFLLSLGNKSVTVFFAREDQKVVLSINGQQFDVALSRDRGKDSRQLSVQDKAQVDKKVTAPMPGRILKILVSEKQSVKVHQPLFIVESMKMENEVQSPKASKVVKINYKENDLVSVGDPVIELDE
jgi:biotin carboxyl carrier protein